MKKIERKHVEKIVQGMKRPENAYKNNFGKVLIMAGSVGMAGAAILCGKAALRTGSGLVKYCVPDEIRDILQIAVPEATCLPRNLEALEENFEAVALGSGLGNNKSNKELLKYILTEYNGNLILDADGLNDINRFHLAYELAESKANIIITPHEGEAARLLRVKNLSNRKDAAIDLTEKFNVITALKGHETIICTPGDNREIYINTETGNPGMATAGSGDVLTGMLASLAGQGINPKDATIAGVFLHGYAGDICAEIIGQQGMLAGDICNAIPKALKDIVN